MTCSERKDWVAIATAAGAVAAAIVAGWAGYEAREARLDVERARVAALMLQVLGEARRTVSTFDCYSIVATNAAPANSAAMHAELEKTDRYARDRMAQIHNSGPEELKTLASGLERELGTMTNDLQDQLLKRRQAWTKEQLDRADSVCKS